MAILINNDLVQFEILEESGIICGTLKPGTVVTLEVAEKITEIRLSIWGNKTLPLISDVSGLISIDDNARDYWATADSMRLLKSVAIVTDKKFQAMIANFFIQFSKPIAPTRLFSNKEDAIKWAERFM
jgi:hypothetical protein